MSEEIKPFRRIIRGLGSVLGGKAGAGIIGLGYLLIATRALGPRDYGVLMLVHGYVTAVCAIVEFPAWQAVIRYGEEAHVERNPARLIRLLNFSAKVELLGGMVAIVTAALLAPVVGPHLGWPPEVQKYAIPYSIALLGSIRSVPAGYLQLVDRFDLLGWHNLVTPLVRLIGSIIVLATGGGIIQFLIVWMVAALAEFATLWGLGFWQARKHLDDPVHKPQPGHVPTENPGIWRFLVSSNADLTLRQLANKLAPLIVGWTLGPAMAGMLSVAQRATVVIDPVAQILGDTSYSTWAKIVHQDGARTKLRKTLLRIALLAVAICLPLILVVSFFSEDLIRLLAGAAFVSAAPIMVYLVIARSIAFMGPPCGSALSAMGHPSWSLWSNLAANFAALSLLPWLLTRYGLFGAAYQSMIQAVVATILLLIMVRRAAMRLPS